MHLLKIAFLLTSISFLFSCNRTEDFENLDLLLGKEWTLQSILEEGIEISDSCDLDDVLIFRDASNFDFEEGALVCNQVDGSQREGRNWSIINNFTTLRMRFVLRGNGGRGDIIFRYVIQELTDSTLIVVDEGEATDGWFPETRTYTN